MNYLLKLFILLTFLTACKQMNAEKTFHVKIQITSGIKSKSFIINYDDGVKSHLVVDSFNNNMLEFHGKFSSQYATLTIKYVNDSLSYDDSYFIGTKPVDLIFLNENTPGDNNPFHSCKVTNAIEIDKSEMSIRRGRYCRNEINDMNIFWEKNGKYVGRVDSITKIFYQKLNVVNLKNIDFIKNNRRNYFSFWWFRNRVVPNALLIYGDDSVQIQKLLAMLNNIFPRKFTNTEEAKALRMQLTGRLTVKENRPAPNFEIKDIQGNLVNLKDFRGKFVLLDFWATWCIPCMKQIPFLKEIRKEYPSEKLTMISISADIDSSRFDSVIKEKGMNWIHIYNAEDLPKRYGIRAYPTLILINTEGQIIYDEWNTEDKKDVLIKLLKEM
jgi:thiol-disulfide isomerase/thioredoxin